MKNIIYMSRKLITAQMDYTKSEYILMLVLIALQGKIGTYDILEIKESHLKKLDVNKDKYFRSLISKEITIEDAESLVTVKLLTTAKYNEAMKIWNVEFNHSIREYFIYNKNCKAKIKLDLNVAVKFSELRALKLYMLLILSKNTDECIYSILELRKFFSVKKEQYKKYSNFKKQYIDLSLAEINKHTDISCIYKEIKYSRSVGKLKFEITKSTKKGIDSKASKNVHITTTLQNDLWELINDIRNSNVTKLIELISQIDYHVSVLIDFVTFREEKINKAIELAEEAIDSYNIEENPQNKQHDERMYTIIGSLENASDFIETITSVDYESNISKIDEYANFLSVTVINDLVELVQKIKLEN